MRGVLKVPLGLTTSRFSPRASICDWERGCVYIVPVMEELALPQQIRARANPKSTTGRLDVFTRLITDFGSELERVPTGYKGKLYTEIVPRTFSIVVEQ